MKKSICISWFGPWLVALLLLAGAAAPAHAYDLLGKKASYLYNRDFQFMFAAGANGLVNDVGLTEDGMDLGWRIGMGFSTTRHLDLEFYYQLSSLPVTSPNPLGGGLLGTHLFFNSEVMRLNYRMDQGPFDNWSIFPFFSAGIGFYQMTAVSPQAGFDFPSGFQLPLAAGFESFIYEDRLSLALEYDYHMLFDDQQSTGTLTLLGLPRASFDVHGVLLQLCWHLF